MTHGKARIYNAAKTPNATKAKARIHTVTENNNAELKPNKAMYKHLYGFT